MVWNGKSKLDGLSANFVVPGGISTSVEGDAATCHSAQQSTS